MSSLRLPTSLEHGQNEERTGSGRCLRPVCALVVQQRAYGHHWRDHSCCRGIARLLEHRRPHLCRYRRPSVLPRRLALHRYAPLPPDGRDHRGPRRCLEVGTRISGQGQHPGARARLLLLRFADHRRRRLRAARRLRRDAGLAGHRRGPQLWLAAHGSDLRRRLCRADRRRADDARRRSARRARTGADPVLLHHQGYGRPRPPGAVLGGDRPQAGRAARQPLRPRVEHDDARAHHARSRRARCGRQCRGRAGLRHRNVRAADRPHAEGAGHARRGEPRADRQGRAISRRS